MRIPFLVRLEMSSVLVLPEHLQAMLGDDQGVDRADPR